MPSSATITAFNVFSPATLIRSGRVNENFDLFRGHLIPISTDTATSSDSLHDLGAPTHRWLNMYGNVAVLTGQSTPASNPTTGQYKIYPKTSTGKLYILNPAGVENEVGAAVPLSVKGDLAVHDGSATVRFPVGITNGQVLSVDSSTTSGLKWITPTGLAFRSISAANTATAADDIIEMTSASFTEPIVGATGNAGKVLRFAHAGTNTSQVYTVNSTALYLNGETLELYSNDVVWKTLLHRIPRVLALASGDPASAASGAPIIFPTEEVDTHSAYDNTTGRFTCPRPGTYHVHGYIDSGTGSVEVRLYKNAVSTRQVSTTDSNGECAFSGTVDCASGDIIDIRPNGTLNVGTLSHICFERISG
jgi:hypothetical protein